MSFSQLPEFANLSVPELAGICASLELLTDTHWAALVRARAAVYAPARTFPGASIWSQEHTVTVHGASSRGLLLQPRAWRPALGPAHTYDERSVV